MPDYLLLESGDRLLLESGDHLSLESGVLSSYLSPSSYIPLSFGPEFVGPTNALALSVGPPLGIPGYGPPGVAPNLLGGVTPTIGPPRTFIAAVRKVLRENTELRSRVVGGWWLRNIPPGVPQPVGVYVIPEFENEGVGGPHYIQTGQFQLSVYSPKPADARSIADLASRTLSDIPELTWATGRLLEFRAASPSSPSPPNHGYGGSDVFGETRVFDYILSGQFDR